MNIGWVGAGADKFIASTEATAKRWIEESLEMGDVVVSGHSPVGGIDIWAEEIGRHFGEPLIFAPEVHQWDPPSGIGYKLRNLAIAQHSERLYVAVVAEYPPDYRGRRFATCYHCVKGGEPTPHVKSGGCWTGLRAKEMGKDVQWVVI
jgi:hypothetical protein